MKHSTSQFLARGGVTIFTQTWTPPDPTALVVLAHGFAEHSGRYAHVAQAMCDADYALAALDHRGHGRSGGPRARFGQISELSGDFALFRSELAASWDLPQILLGHSMGGSIVLDHLQGTHDPVVAAVLSGPFVRNAAAVNPLLKKVAPIIARILPGAPTETLDSADISRDPAIVTSYDEDPLNYRGAIPAATAAAMLDLESSLIESAPRISEPVLIVHGTADRLAAVSGSRDLAGAIGSQVVDLKTYDGLYHEVFNEPEQDTVLADVIAWIGERL